MASVCAQYHYHHPELPLYNSKMLLVSSLRKAYIQLNFPQADAPKIFSQIINTFDDSELTSTPERPQRQYYILLLSFSNHTNLLRNCSQ